MFKKLVHKIVGDPTKKYLDSLKPIVAEVNGLEVELQQLPDEALRSKTAEFKERLGAGETLEDILPEAFAVVREASRRTTGLRHYDVQIMGGVLLHRGEVVEMRTGEGKTLVATLPLYLNALLGQGVHLVTVNEYLARRDGGWMGKIFHLLGLTVGCIGPQQFSALYDPDYVNPGAELEDERLVHWRPCTRQQAYLADVTYGISSEFGFDYLRDNMANRREQLVQRQLYFAVIDEVDNVLIDEARTPLIISGPSGTTGQDYVRFSQYIRGLKRNTVEDEEEEPNGHYNIDEKSQSINLTELGIAEIEKRIPEINTEAGDSLYDPRFFHLTYYVDNALKAQYLFKRDQEYVVQNGEVLIVDERTGRLMPGRRYSDGLHEAIEAKEGVQVRRENVTVATITLQNYFRLYEKLAGMTGTAMTDAEEFHDIYKLDVTPLPTNVEYIVETGAMGLEEQKRKVEGGEETYYVRSERPEETVFFRRIDFPDQVYGTVEAKDQAIMAEIVRVRGTGRPILVGTTSVEHSETIHRLLRRQGVDHAVLNAKIHQSEALIVAQAGRKGAVTISTNMAGRGTDILLGGNPEGLAAEIMEKELFDRQDLTQLAYHLLSEGEEAAREFARKHGKLTEELVGALQQTKAEFDNALTEIESAQVIGYLARALQEPYAIDYNDIREVLRLVRAGQLGQAREYLDNLGKDVALVDEAVRLWSLYSRYEQVHKDPRLAAQFVAETLFEKLYNARAALIRAVMAGNRQEAQRLTQTIPGLHTGLIDRIERLKEQTKREREEVWRLGGLHVIGSERHESRRIDNQLRGRAARQGDPGSSRFFLSLEDELMRRFGGERLKNFMSRTSLPDDTPIESGLLDRLIESSQERIEGYNFDIRKNVVEYDDVMSKQREAIYGQRRAILLGEDVDLDVQVQDAFAATLEELVDNYLVNYPDYVSGEIDRAITAFSTEATDTVNVNGVLVRMRGLLPGVVELDRAALAEASAEELSRQLMRLAHENLDSGYNLYQFLQAVSRFIPLLPPVPNLGTILSSRRSGHLQIREKLRQEFLAQLEALFNDFLAGQVVEAERENIWQRTVDRLNEAFARFSVEGLSVRTIQKQQNAFKKQVDEALRDLLMDSLSALDEDQLASALTGYVNQRSEDWSRQIGEEEYRNFQRLLLLDAIDREWRDYLTAMDDLRREIGLEAFGQRDPKVEYKRRSFQMFADMRRNIERNVVERFFREIAGHQNFIQQQEAAAAYQAQLSQAGYQVVRREKGKGVELRRDMPKVGRNDPCPCGSGKKYKHCHMRKDQAAAGNGQQQGKRVRQRR
ncbi:MAG: preprotein translocase subunit SecA [Chloroflexi bacterium]|nr:preprotein translocase subunit SecA [Chloroflexota bacterium]MCI0650074.1 preprotein translocase subunit SecA [Chloroflexota bacterium]